MKKVLLPFFICLVIIVSGCQSKDFKTNTEITARVTITDFEQNVLLDKTCKLNQDEASAVDALTFACQSENISYQNKNGLFDGFAGIESTAEDGWLFYYNGKLAEKGLNETSLTIDGENLIEMKYVNFSDAFSQ